MTARLHYSFMLIACLSFAVIGCGEEKEAYDSSGNNNSENESPASQNQDGQLGTTQAGDNPPSQGGRVTWQQVRDGAVTRTNPETGVTWTILGIRTDGGDHTRAKTNAEATLAAHRDIVGMVGLWAYNPPAILQAVQERDMLDQVTIIGFDEDQRTLDAIGRGQIAGTVVQNPYEFGFRSVQHLAATIRGQEVDVPDDKLMYVPTRIITRENIREFYSLTQNIRNGHGPTPTYDATQYDTSEQVSIHFVTNVVDPFWELAQQGCNLGAQQFNARVVFFSPPTGQVSEQLAHVETMIVNDVDGLAISVLDGAGQVGMINEWADKMTVITVDSDSPNSDRLFYLGTDNVAGGRQVGDLMAEQNPQGGKVMIFVGSVTMANGQQRSQGVIDALFGQ